MNPFIRVVNTAPRNGLIPAIAPEIEKLHKAGFRASQELERRILAEAGE